MSIFSINTSCLNLNTLNTSNYDISNNIKNNEFTSHIYRLNFKYPSNIQIGYDLKNNKNFLDKNIIIKNYSIDKSSNLEKDLTSFLKEISNTNIEIKELNKPEKIKYISNNDISIIFGKYPNKYKYSLTNSEVDSFSIITNKKYTDQIITSLNFKMSENQYLTGAIDIIKSNSILGSEFDWENWEKEVIYNFENTKKINESIKFALKNLDDNHSTFWDKEHGESIIKGNDKFTGIDFLPYINNQYIIFEVFPNSPAEKQGLEIGDIITSKINNSDGTTSFKLKRELENKEWETTITPDFVNTNIEPSVKLIDSDILYIELTGSTGTYAYQEYPNIVHNKVKKILENNTIRGWIIDLRKNTGGATWPMLNAIGPLLGNGDIGSRFDNLGNKTSWKYNNGKFYSGNQLVSELKTDPFRLENNNSKICVLMSSTTSSAGEGVAISLKGKNNTYFIGEDSNGKTTGTNTFILNDGAWLNIANTVNSDRNGLKYFKSIKPDLFNYVDWKFFGDEKKDTNILKAIEWINK